MADIDTPERGQAFYEQPKQSLGNLIFGKDVTLDCRKKKSFDRWVCLVWLGDNNINVHQIRLGMAWWARGFVHEQTAYQQLEYEYAETQARGRGLGFWSDPDPVLPWELRHQRRNVTKR